MRAALLILALIWPAFAAAQLVGDDIDCGILNEGDVASSNQTVNCGPDPELVEGIDDTTRANNAMLNQILQQLQGRPEVAVARASGITAAALVELARRIADDVDDPQTAFAELERAVEVAIRVQREGRTTGGDFVDEVLRRMAALSREGDYDAAAAEIDAALAREEAESRARQIRLLDAGLEQDILRRNADSAAARLARKAELELPEGRSLFTELRRIGDEWYFRGRDKGLNFDLRVAIELARLSLDQANVPEDRGIALNDLGNALWTLGQREAGTDRLEQAVAAYRAALEEFTRERAPLAWATTQMNLGNALASLGEREAGIGRLEQAVAAYRAALEEFTRERVPLDWAMTQMNLGTALAALGVREAGTGRLEQAVDAYRAALEERTRERVPLDWAMTQMNLGNALLTLGQREAGTDRLEQSVDAYRAALEERTRERVPLAWALTQMNLGNALRTLGEREAGTNRLEQAVGAFRAALEERTRERMPLDWALTQMNLGNALQALGEREAGTDRLEQAVAAYRAALEEWTQERVPLDWAMTQMNLGIALATLGEREAGTDRLEQTVDAYRAALEELRRDRVPLDWALVQGNLIDVELAYFDKTGEAAHLDAAEGYLAAAREVFDAAGATQYVAEADRQAAEIAARRDGG